MKRLLAVLMALALAALLGTVLEAKRPGRGGGKGEAPVDGVIIAYDSIGEGRWYKFAAADGSDSTPVYCGGDLTHNPDVQRYFVFTQYVENVEDTYPGRGGQRVEIFVSPYESAFAPECALPLPFEAPNPLLNTLPIQPRWSLDGKRVAFTGITYNDGTETYGIWVADVVFEEEEPISLRKLTVINAHPYSPLSWHEGNPWITYSGYTNNEPGIWVANVETGEYFNVTNDPSISGFHPAFSPVQGDNRLAFMRNTNTGGGSIYNHIFVGFLQFDIEGNPETLIDITQVTSKKNANLAQMSNPSWSPDGKHLLFSGTDLSADIDFDIYRIRADGKGKSVVLTYGSPEPDLFWTGGHWRAIP